MCVCVRTSVRVRESVCVQVCEFVESVCVCVCRLCVCAYNCASA